MPTRREMRRDDLFLLAVAEPNGITVDDMMQHLGCNHRDVNQAIRDLRAFLGDTDDLNFPCDPQGQGERWLYRLVGNYDDVRAWAANRVGDAESRLRTMQAMLASIVRATDGRTVAGRRARIMETALRHLVEDLDLMQT